jgi:DNA polymerase V
MYISPMSNTSISNVPLFVCSVAAGFPSPADDYIEAQLDLNSYLISSPSSTFFARLDANTPLIGGVKKGSVLIVDRSITPAHNKIVVAAVNDKFLLRRLKLTSGEQILVTDDLKDKPIIINQDSYIWGVVTSVITKLQ